MVVSSPFHLVMWNDINMHFRGNTVSANTMDTLDTAIQATVPAGQHFGPSTW